MGSRRRLAFWFCGKILWEKQRHKGAMEGGSKRNSWWPARPAAPALSTQQPVSAPPPPPPLSGQPWGRCHSAFDPTVSTAPAQAPCAKPEKPKRETRRLGLPPPYLICLLRTSSRFFGLYRFCPAGEDPSGRHPPGDETQAQKFQTDFRPGGEPERTRPCSAQGAR